MAKGSSRKLPKTSVITKYWEENMPEHLYDDQIHDGQCWACGYFGPKIERAHIKAKCEGGTDNADNLHLLCRRCHQESEGLSGKKYWDWYELKLIGFDFGLSQYSTRICAALKNAGVKPDLATTEIGNEQMRKALAYIWESEKDQG